MAITAACSAMMVLPLPTSPWRRRFIGAGFSQSAAISARTRFLRRRGLERQDALQRFAHSVFPQTERDGVFLASGLAVQSEAELVQEKFLEDKPLLRRRTKRVQGIEGFAGFWKVRANQKLRRAWG